MRGKRGAGKLGAGGVGDVFARLGADVADLVGGDGGGQSVIGRGGGDGARGFQRGIGFVAGGLAGEVGEGDAADPADLDMGGEVGRCVVLRQTCRGGATRHQQVISRSGGNVFADNQVSGDVPGGGIAVDGHFGGGNAERQGSARVDPDLGAKAGDRSDAGGLVRVEPPGQQAFEALFLGFQGRISLVVDGLTQGGPAFGLGVFGDGPESGGTLGAVGVGQGERRERRGDQAMHPGVGFQPGDVGFRGGACGAPVRSDRAWPAGSTDRN